MKKNLIVYLQVGFVVFIGLVLRLYQLNLNNPPLYADETGQYHVLYKLLYGLVNPLQYLISLSFSYTWFLGLTPLGVRLPSAIYGSALIVLAYAFGMNVSKGKKTVGILNALLVAILPWSFMLSRIGHTHVVIVIVLSILHAIIYLRSKSLFGELLSFLPLALATIYYPSVLFILPFVLIFTIYRFHRHLAVIRRTYLIAIAIFIILFTFYVIKRFNFFNPAARGLDMAIWRDVNTTADTNKYRGLSWNSSPSLFSFYLPPEQVVNKLVYNTVTANINIFAKNYLSFFSPDWLFLKGDAILRHSTGQVGTFYLFLLPFLLYGSFTFLKTAQSKEKTVFLIWILASPISAAITKDGAGYLLRAATLLPFLTYFCALGLMESFNLVQKRWRWPYGILLGFVAIYSIYTFFYSYFHVYPAVSARSYEYGFKELADFQVKNGGASLLVIWDGYYHNNDFRFWQKTPFEEYRSFPVQTLPIGETTFYQTFPNLFFAKLKTTADLIDFIKLYKPQYLVLPDRYFLNYPSELDTKLGPPHEVILYPDRTPALSIYSVNPEILFLLEK